MDWREAMKDKISYHNKDIISKCFAETFKEKSLAVYGLKIPRIKMILPTNLPAVSANELRIDNLFLLEDDSIAVIDYESKYTEEDKVKYLNYITRVINRYKNEGILDVNIRMIVIYTADVGRAEVRDKYVAGTLSYEIDTAFLSEIVSEEVARKLDQKVKNKEPLTDEDLLQFIILPLTYKGADAKKKSLSTTIELAKHIDDEVHSIFVLSGILVFSDKIIDKELADGVKEWISMTKVAKLFEEEKEQAVKQATEQVTKQVTNELTAKHKAGTEKFLKEKGWSDEEIKEFIQVAIS
jgi:hypothetical protein